MGKIGRPGQGTLALLAVLSVSAFALSGIGFTPGASAARSARAVTSGCGAPSKGTGIFTMQIDGLSRHVIVHVPTGYTNSTKVPLVLNLHGSGSTAAQEDVFSDMDVTANADGFIVVYPQGLIPDGSGYDWNVPGVPLTGGRAVPKGSANDVKFLTSLVGVLEHEYCINPSAVYATGFSGGAREVSQLACSDSTLFAAVAPVSGLRHPKPCSTKRAVPIISFHGSADAVDPFDGKGEAYWSYSVSTAAKDWATQDHCASKPTVTKSTGLVLSTYGGCKGGAEVELYEVIGEGHEWPGGPTLPASYIDVLGPQSNAVNANNVMWSFFEAHQL
jgi:polyhydroxybutyrate depolymerase